MVLAGLLALGSTYATSAVAEGTLIHEATPAERDDAQIKFETGRQLYSQGKLDEALEWFIASYDAVRSPNANLMVARTLHELDRDVEAFLTAEVVAAEAKVAAVEDPKYEKTQEQAQTLAAKIRPTLGALTLRVDNASESSTLFVAGRKIPREEWSRPIVVPPGTFEVVVTSASGREAKSEVTVAAGSTGSLAIRAPDDGQQNDTMNDSPSDTTSTDSGGAPVPPLVWVAGGVGVVGLATFATFGSLHKKKIDDLESKCPDKRCDPSLQSDADQGKRFKLAANLGLGIGVAGLATGAVLFFTGRSNSAAPADRARAERRGTKVSIGLGSVHVSGRF